MEVKLEPEEYPEDELEQELEPPPPPPEVSFMEQQPDVSLKNLGVATTSVNVPSAFLSHQGSEKASHHIIPRRNSHEKTSAAANLQPEFPQDPSCKYALIRAHPWGAIIHRPSRDRSSFCSIQTFS